jgi:hypothetical protein
MSDIGVQTSRHPSISPLGAKHKTGYNYWNPWRIAKIGAGALAVYGGYAIGRDVYHYIQSKREYEANRQRVINDKSVVPAGYAPDSYYGNTGEKKNIINQTRIEELRNKI